MVLNFELPKLIDELKKRKPGKVLVQLPEGIKRNALEIQKEIKNLGIEVIFSGETCWGGCSISTHEAGVIGADLIIHFGHAKFIESDFPIIYVEVRDELNLKPILEKSLDQIKNYKKLGLSYSIQHRHDLDMIKKFYEDNGKEIVISDKKGFAAYQGHVIGCEFTGLKTIQEEVEAFIIIGNNFHSMGAALAVIRPVFLVDVYNDKVTEMAGVREKMTKQRIMSIERFKDARKVAIISEVKPGQKFGTPKILIEKLEEQGKEVLTIIMDEMSPDKLMNFYDIEAFVELGCPRIAIDDYAKYPKPIITYKEAQVVIGNLKIEDLIDRGFI